jgi:hypothetical protein
MEIPIGHRTKGNAIRHCSVLQCDADSIPLSYLKRKNSGAIKKLAKMEIVSIEHLHAITKEKLCDHITNRSVRRNILMLKNDIAKKAFIPNKDYVIRLDKKIRSSNIRITSIQRAKIIAVYVFAKILSNIDVLLKFILNLHTTDIPFRQKATLEKVYDISLRFIAKSAA